MKKEEALQIIAEAVNLAISRGVYGLVEVTNIVKALEKLNEIPKNNSENN